MRSIVTNLGTQVKFSKVNLPIYLFVLPWSLHHLGGVNQVVVNLARQIVSQGDFEPVVLVLDWNAKHPVWEIHHGLRTVRWRVRGNEIGSSFKQRVANWIWRQGFFPAFKDFCKSYNVAVINPHYPTEAALSLEAAATACAPELGTIVSFHGADLAGIQATDPPMFLAWTEMLRRCRGVVVCSSAMGRKVKEKFGIDASVIHNGIDVAEFSKIAGPPSRSPRRVILNVGRFEAKKGQDVLVRAFAALSDEYTDVDLVLIGVTDIALQPLQRICSELRIQHRVHFHADMPHPEVARYFAGASIFVLSSRQEPFGIVLLEAGCLALPVVATAVGGVPEVLDDGITARLVQPDLPDELAAAIRAILDDAPAAQAMGERLRDHVIRNFSWKKAHDRYLQIAGTHSESI